MHLLEALLKLRLTPEEPPPDGAVVLQIVSKAPAQPVDSGRLRSDRCSTGCSEATANNSVGFSWHPFSKPAVAAGAVGSFPKFFAELPPLAASLVWVELSHAEKRSVRLAQPDVCTVFSRTVGSLEVSWCCCCRTVDPERAGAASCPHPIIESARVWFCSASFLHSRACGVTWPGQFTGG